MSDVTKTELLEIEHEQVFPAHHVTKLFELEHLDEPEVTGFWSSNPDSSTYAYYRLRDEKGKLVKSFSTLQEFNDYVERDMDGVILTRA
jgi:hypothetical protein